MLTLATSTSTQVSKIGKVMRHIHALNASKIPRNEEFHFKERAKVLIDKWGVLLPKAQPNGEKGETPAANGTPVAAATNGKKGAAKASPAKDESPAAMDQDAKSGDADAIADDEAPAGAEESMLADVTMSEAA